MSFQITLLVVPFALSAVLTTALTIYGLQQLDPDRPSKTVLSFIGITGFATVWTLSRTLQFLFTNETVTELFITGIYVGLSGAVVSIFAFAMSFTGRQQWLTWRRVTLVSLLPAVAVVVALTNPAHNLFWTGGFTYYGDLYIIDRSFEPLFYVYFAYIQLVLFSGIYLLLRMALSSAKVYRRQTAAFIVGSLAPTVTGVLFSFEATPFFPAFVDLTPIGFTVTGLCFGYAIFRYQMLDLVPVARDTVIESMRDGYIVLDTDDRIVDLNNAAKEILATNENVVGAKIDRTLPECASLLDEHEYEGRSESEFSLEIDDDRRFLVASLSSLHQDQQRIGRLLLLRDVTERRAIQKRYQALIENSSDVILVVEPDGEITYASPSISNVTGTDPTELTGQNAFDMVHESERDEFESIINQLIDNPGEKIRHEYRTMDADGNWLYMEASVWNLLDNPFVEGIVVNAREITERKKREQEVKEKNEQLERANEQLEQFASVISHDLRNPINVAKGHAQLAEETGREESFEKIESSLERMEAIIDDVLTLAREGEPIGETEPVSLEAVATEAWGHVATDDATLEVIDDVTFEADSDRLLQLFENCFRNAHEHVGADVTVRVGSENGCFYVEDDGPGIPEDKRDEVFESGHTTNQGGTGLGLSIVEGIADAHGWSVRATDGSDGGARFEFEGIEKPTAQT